MADVHSGGPVAPKGFQSRVAGRPVPSIPDFWGVIPAGGAGTRLWPLSRAGSPKFLHDLTGSGESLLQSTVRRLRPLCGGEGAQLFVVTGARHAEAVREQLPDLPAERVLAEPSPRDSMAAIGWAAALVERINPDAVIGSFAADHVITPNPAFHAVVREAVSVARSDRIVTIGIAPTYPATGFGYIHQGDMLEMPGSSRAYTVAQFVEKPQLDVARQYIATGEYRWNAGMFVVKAKVLLDILHRYHPNLADGLRALAAEPERLEKIWPTLDRIAIDHAVAEPAADAGDVAVVLSDFAWDDVGDFASLASLIPRVGGGDVTILGDESNVTALDTTGMIAAHGDRMVAVVGMRDVVVADTPDALLVTTREHAQKVKDIVAELKARGREDVT